MATTIETQLPQTTTVYQRPRTKNSGEWIRCIHMGQQLEQSGRGDLAETFYKRAVQLAFTSKNTNGQGHKLAEYGIKLEMASMEPPLIPDSD